jgi:protein-S-isoprenylcysteine O-methyltransferase Ste14
MRADDGVDRTGVEALRTADAARLVDCGALSRLVRSTSRIQRLGRNTERPREALNRHVLTRRTSIDVRLAASYRFGIGVTARIAATCALRLRQTRIEAFDERAFCRGKWHPRSMASVRAGGNNFSMATKLSFGSRGGWWVVAQALFLSIAFFLPMSEAGFTVPPDPLHRLGWLTVSLGFLVAAAGLRVLEPRLTPFPRPRDDARLEMGGIYAYLRHPIYAGLIIAAVGWSLLWSSHAGLWHSIALAIFFDLKADREERWLRERFSDYGAYSKRVRRFIPGIY